MSLPVQSLKIAADTLVIGGKVLYFGYEAVETGGAAMTAKIFDGTSNAGKQIGSIGLASGGYVGPGPFNRGVLCEQGIFVDYTSGAADVVVYYTPEVILDEILVNFANSQRYVERYLTDGDVHDLFPLTKGL